MCSYIGLAGCTSNGKLAAPHGARAQPKAMLGLVMHDINLVNLAIS